MALLYDSTRIKRIDFSFAYILGCLPVVRKARRITPMGRRSRQVRSSGAGEKAAGRATDIQLLRSWGQWPSRYYRHSAPPELGTMAIALLQTFSSSGAGRHSRGKCPNSRGGVAAKRRIRVNLCRSTIFILRQ